MSGPNITWRVFWLKVTDRHSTGQPKSFCNTQTVQFFKPQGGQLQSFSDLAAFMADTTNVTEARHVQ